MWALQWPWGGREARTDTHRPAAGRPWREQRSGTRGRGPIAAAAGECGQRAWLSRNFHTEAKDCPFS